MFPDQLELDPYLCARPRVPSQCAAQVSLFRMKQFVLHEGRSSWHFLTLIRGSCFYYRPACSLKTSLQGFDGTLNPMPGERERIYSACQGSQHTGFFPAWQIILTLSMHSAGLGTPVPTAPVYKVVAM